MEISEADKEEQKFCDFVANFKLKDGSTLKKYIEVKANDKFTKRDILEITGWSNGTFYNRLAHIEANNPSFKFFYKKQKEAGDRVEKLVFNKTGFVEILKLYCALDLKRQVNVNKASNDNVNDNIKLTDSNREQIELYNKIIAEKDARIDEQSQRIESLENQVKELTDVIKIREQKEIEAMRAEALREQQKFINTAEGNKKQNFWARFFKKNNDAD